MENILFDSLASQENKQQSPSDITNILKVEEENSDTTESRSSPEYPPEEVAPPVVTETEEY